MELSNFMGENMRLLQQALPDMEQIRYCVKLSSVTNRREESGVTNKFASMMSGIGNLVSDTISSSIFNSYFVGTANGSVGYISEKTSPIFFDSKEIMARLVIEPGMVQFNFTFETGILQNAVIQLSSDTLSSVFWGDLTEIFKDFDTETRISLNNLSKTYAFVRMSKPSQSPDKPYEMIPFYTIETLISYDSEYLYLNNYMKTIPFHEVLLCYCSPERYCFVIKEQNELVFYEVFRNRNKNRPELGFNLLAEAQTTIQENLEIEFPDKITRLQQFLSICQWKDLVMVAADNDLLFPYQEGLVKGGVFTQDSTLYIRLEDGIVQKYTEMLPIIQTLSLLPSRYDTLFMATDEPLPYVIDNDVKYLRVQKDGLELDGQFYAFSKMQNFKYCAKNYSCSIEFVYEKKALSFLTAEVLGVHISNTQEQVATSEKIKYFTINQLYDYYCKNQAKNFIAGTLSEIFKTNKLLNFDVTVDELLDAIEADDSAVLRNALQSVLGKFKNMDDLQEKLIQKLTLLEIQRRKIQKMLDEWILFYPHYAASTRVEWLKNIFSPYIKEELLKTEYWNCVSHFKRIFSGMSVYIQKTLNEIALCTNRLISVLPEEVKRADIPAMLRVSPRNRINAVKTGANAMLAVATGAELANFFVRGFSMTNPLVLSMSVKMMVDSYAKDVSQRKDVKAFGIQALEWWQILMQGLTLHIMELTKGFNDYSQVRIRRDTDLFLKIPPAYAGKVKDVLSEKLKQEIIEGVNQKYLEIMPQFNLRISNILEDVKFQSDFCKGTIKEFEENLYI